MSGRPPIIAAVVQMALDSTASLASLAKTEAEARLLSPLGFADFTHNQRLQLRWLIFRAVLMEAASGTFKERRCALAVEKFEFGDRDPPSAMSAAFAGKHGGIGGYVDDIVAQMTAAEKSQIVKALIHLVPENRSEL